MSNKIEYVGKDLEAMDFAVNYHLWILSLIEPFLGKNLVEVGAGTGSFSEILLDTKPDTLALVEPSEMFEILKKKDFSNKNKANIKIYKNIFANVAREIQAEKKPDSIIYINVLEHIVNDSLELELVNRTLAENGARNNFCSCSFILIQRIRQAHRTFPAL